MRIFYICPDLETPSGGIKQLYTHVRILRENGYDAYIVHSQKGFKVNWFENNVPIVYTSSSLVVNSDDTLVIAEGYPQNMKLLMPLPAKKVVIALNPAYAFEMASIGENWKNYGIKWVMAGARVIEDLIRWSMGINNIHTIGIAVDYDMFNYVPQIKKPQVAYISRKDFHSPLVEKIIKCNNEAVKKIEFIEIKDLRIEDYAQILKESDIFLSTSIHEGIHWSILEAMACGCICIGYHGIGGKDYIVGAGDKQNFILAESTNFIDLAEKLAGLVEMLNNNDTQIDTIRQNAFATAARYSPDFEVKTLLQFWETFFQAEFAGQPACKLQKNDACVKSLLRRRC